MGYRAVFRDANDRTYSAPLEWDASTSSWLMRTNEGLQKIVYLFRDDEAGNLFFECYREDATSPVEPDTRLHVEGQGFRALQEAVAKERLRNEAERASRRAEALDSLNQPDARRIAEARANATALAQRWSPKTPGVIPPSQLTQEHMTDQQARARKLTINRLELEEARWRKKKDSK